MDQKDDDGSAHLPQILRDLRLRKGVTVHELARRIGRSAGFISQIERGLSQPTVEDLHAVGKALGVHSMYFLQQLPSKGYDWLSNPGTRRTLSYANGITDQVVSPALSNKFIMLETHLESGAAFEDHNLLESEEQAGYVLEGQLTLWVNGEATPLQKGDAFQITSTVTYRCVNTSTLPARVLWIYG